MIYVENNDGEILLINRNHKPFHGWHCLPSGLMHLGETLDQAAHREVYEKTTIFSDDGLENVGVLDIRYVERKTEDIFMHTVAFIYRCKFTGDRQLLADKVTRYGQLSWSRLDRADVLPEVHAVQKLVNKGGFAHESVTFEEPTPLVQLSTIFADDMVQEIPAVRHKYRLAMHGLHAQIVHPQPLQK